MLDLAHKHLLGRYLQLHSTSMVDALRSSVAQLPSGDAEPEHALPFCGAWAGVLATAKREVTALQGAC